MAGIRRRAGRRSDPSRRDLGPLRRHRVAVSGLAGLGAATFVGGDVGPVAAVLAAAAAWVAVTRAEPPGVRRRAEQVRRDLPAIVTLLAAALRSGAPPTDALAAVCCGPPRARLGPALHRRRAAGAWATTPPARGARSRATRTSDRSAGRWPGLRSVALPSWLPSNGSPSDLAAAARASVEDRARAVGVKAAVPLGLCLLPSFVLIGIVPLVAGLAGSLGW